MEQMNKDQDPPHGGSWTRQPTGELVLNAQTKPADVETTATPADPAPTAAAGAEQE